MTTLEEIKGIGSKSLNALKKIGITSPYQLLTYYPFRYEVMQRSDITTLEQNDKIIMDGVVATIPSLFHFHKKLDQMRFKMETSYSIMNVIIYNRGFLKSKLKPGTIISVVGKYDKKHNTIVASELEFNSLSDIPRIDPIYHATYAISSKQLRNYINSVLSLEVEDYIPTYLKEKYHFLEKNESIKEVHQPSTVNKLKQARLRLKYEELFLFMGKMAYLKQNKTGNVGLKRTIDEKQLEIFLNSLPFSLTIDQKRAVDAIKEDLENEKRMNRLVQGDVGSGKTVVAMISMYMNYLSGYQSALMAPTEILAIQHYENAKKLFEPFGIQVGLLTGKLKAKEKRTIRAGMEDGSISVMIGTHALFTDDLIYHNLGLVITDEQHRFGVNQRASLKNKGITPDILYMSATPIPRTYALTLYGDMDVSNIKTMPNGRKPVITLLRKESEIRDVLERMHEELKQHHQIYVIAPLIEESEKINLENVYALETKMNQAFGKICKIGVLHGKMTGEEKEKIMESFQKNEISILISTTVIEVGVDVKNATMMVIFDSFRFGLSALHQLRGRVGRGSLQSYCILISNQEKERLKILTETTDGFKISEEDFLLRGSGDLFGVKQSGDMVFALADLKKDYKILLQAKEDSEIFLKSEDYNKLEYKKIKEKIETIDNLS